MGVDIDAAHLSLSVKVLQGDAPHTTTGSRKSKHWGRQPVKVMSRLAPAVGAAKWFINRIKHYRRIFSQFDKLTRRYLGFLSFVDDINRLR
jgi:hypothetical protein